MQIRRDSSRFVHSVDCRGSLPCKYSCTWLRVPYNAPVNNNATAEINSVSIDRSRRCGRSKTPTSKDRTNAPPPQVIIRCIIGSKPQLSPRAVPPFTTLRSQPSVHLPLTISTSFPIWSKKERRPNNSSLVAVSSFTSPCPHNQMDLDTRSTARAPLLTAR